MSAPAEVPAPGWRLYRIPEAMELLSLSRTVIRTTPRSPKAAPASFPLRPWPTTWRC
jgi:hypothetical protein